MELWEEAAPHSHATSPALPVTPVVDGPVVPAGLNDILESVEPGQQDDLTHLLHNLGRALEDAEPDVKSEPLDPTEQMERVQRLGWTLLDDDFKTPIRPKSIA